MDSSTGHSHAFLVAVTFIFIFSLTIPPSNSGESLKQGEMVLGSRPPSCVGGCFGCRPCVPTLVVPDHQKQHVGTPLHEDHSSDHRKDWFRTSSSGEADNGYYLLSWRCRCGDKIFPP